jgi:hypothetical protein
MLNMEQAEKRLLPLEDRLVPNLVVQQVTKNLGVKKRLVGQVVQKVQDVAYRGMVNQQVSEAVVVQVEGKMVMNDRVDQWPGEGVVVQQVERRKVLQKVKLETGHRGPREMVDQRAGQGGVNLEVNQRLKSQAVQEIEKPVLVKDQDVKEGMKSQAVQMVEKPVLIMDQDVEQRLKSQAVQKVEKHVLVVDQDVKQRLKSQAVQKVEKSVLVVDQKETRILDQDPQMIGKTEKTILAVQCGVGDQDLEEVRIEQLEVTDVLAKKKSFLMVMMRLLGDRVVGLPDKKNRKRQVLWKDQAEMILQTVVVMRMIRMTDEKYRKRKVVEKIVTVPVMILQTVIVIRVVQLPDKIDGETQVVQLFLAKAILPKVRVVQYSLSHGVF